MIKTNWRELKKENLINKVFLLPTDTIYGFSSLFDDKVANKQIRELKNTRMDKLFIHLISDISDLEKFGIFTTKQQINFLKKVWHGRVTIILKNKLGEKISFRIPAHKKLRKFIKQVGPIISTSANISGEKNVLKPDDLKQFIQDKIDFYIDEGELKGEASNILEFLR